MSHLDYKPFLISSRAGLEPLEGENEVPYTVFVFGLPLNAAIHLHV